jgi:Na+/H+-translocating membrane pyrophosphatase
MYVTMLTGGPGHVKQEGESEALVASNKESDEELKEIYETIREGAQSFLWAEYQICFIFIAVFGLLILVLTSRVSDAEGNGVWEWNIGALTATSFLVGGLTSILSGYIGEVANMRPAPACLPACLPAKTVRACCARLLLAASCVSEVWPLGRSAIAGS